MFFKITNPVVTLAPGTATTLQAGLDNRSSSHRGSDAGHYSSVSGGAGFTGNPSRSAGVFSASPGYFDMHQVSGPGETVADASRVFQEQDTIRKSLLGNVEKLVSLQMFCEQHRNLCDEGALTHYWDSFLLKLIEGMKTEDQLNCMQICDTKLASLVSWVSRNPGCSSDQERCLSRFFKQLASCGDLKFSPSEGVPGFEDFLEFAVEWHKLHLTGMRLYELFTSLCADKAAVFSSTWGDFVNCLCTVEVDGNSLKALKDWNLRLEKGMGYVGSSRLRLLLENIENFVRSQASGFQRNLEEPRGVVDIEEEPEELIDVVDIEEGAMDSSFTEEMEKLQKNAVSLKLIGRIGTEDTVPAISLAWDVFLIDLVNQKQDPAARLAFLSRLNPALETLISLFGKLYNSALGKEGVRPFLSETINTPKLTPDSFLEKLDNILLRFKMYDVRHSGVERALMSLATKEAELLVNFVMADCFGLKVCSLKGDCSDSDFDKARGLRLHIIKKLADMLNFRRLGVFQSLSLSDVAKKAETYPELGSVMTGISKELKDIFSPARVLGEVREMYLEKVDELKLKYFHGVDFLILEEKKKEQQKKFFAALIEQVLEPMSLLLEQQIDPEAVVNTDNLDTDSVKSKLSQLFEKDPLWERTYSADRDLSMTNISLSGSGEAGFSDKYIKYDSMTGKFFVLRSSPGSKKYPRPLDVEDVKKIDFNRVPPAGHLYLMLRQLVVEGKLARTVLIDYLKDTGNIDLLKNLSKVNVVPYTAGSVKSNPFLKAIKELNTDLSSLKPSAVIYDVFKECINYGFDKGLADGRFEIMTLVDRNAVMADLFALLQEDKALCAHAIGRMKKDFVQYLLKKQEVKEKTDLDPEAVLILGTLDKLTEAMMDTALDLMSLKAFLVSLKRVPDAVSRIGFYLGRLLSRQSLEKMIEFIYIKNTTLELNLHPVNKSAKAVSRFLEEEFSHALKTKSFDVDGELVPFILSGHLTLDNLTSIITGMRSRAEVTEIVDLVSKTVGLPFISPEIRGYLLSLPEWPAAAAGRRVAVPVAAARAEARREMGAARRPSRLLALLEEAPTIRERSLLRR